MNTPEDICLRFPAILREKIKNKDISFPAETQYHFSPIKAYRSIEREKEDHTQPNRNDFKSYAELGKKKTRGQRINDTSPEYYGTSLFMKKEIIENIMKFPNPHKKMAVGYVVQEGGPQLTNRFTEHVCWWLFEDADLSGFVIVEEGEKDE